MQFIDALFENTDITYRINASSITDLSDLKKLDSGILATIHEQCRSRVSAQFTGMAVTDSRGVALLSLFATLSLVMISGSYATKEQDAAEHSVSIFLAIGAIANVLAALLAAWSIFPQRVDYPGDKASQWVGDDDFYASPDREKEAYFGMISNCQIQTARNSEICRIKAYRQRFAISLSVFTLAILTAFFLITT